jgi:hypothetical protein
MFLRGVLAGVEAVMAERLGEGVHRRACRLYLRFADLRKAAGTDIAGEQAKYSHHYQQLQQSETA